MGARRVAPGFFGSLEPEITEAQVGAKRWREPGAPSTGDRRFGYRPYDGVHLVNCDR